MDKKTEISIRLKQFRESLSMNQESFSDLLGIKRTTYTMVENGSTQVGSLMLLDLYNKKKLNPTWLLTGIGAMLLGGDSSIVNSNVNHGIEAKQEEVSAKHEDDRINQLLESKNKQIESLREEVQFLRTLLKP